MIDQEMLELAAKAAGIKLGEWHGTGYWVDMGDSPYGAVAKHWNPLRDDGDALRLAVKLKMDIDNTDGEHTQAYCAGKYGTEANGDDPCAATRRAIVHAAAEIGRSMK